MTLGPRPALVLTLPALASALLMLAQPAGAQTEPAKADAGLEMAQESDQSATPAVCSLARPWESHGTDNGSRVN